MAFIPGSFTPKGSVIFTSSQNWVVPAGVHRIKILAIGGGGGGGGGYSSSYVGGGGGSGAILYVDMIVVPGTTLGVVVGAGGSPGTGGASPTSGGGGGQTYISWNGMKIITANPGAGGGAASSSANGSGGSGGGGGESLMQGIRGSTPVFVLDANGASGNGGGGQTGGVTPTFGPGFTSTSSTIVYGFGAILGSVAAESFGNGSPGGNVNANGQPGIQGAVVIWWGD